jgi:hypothetical protein
MPDQGAHEAQSSTDLLELRVSVGALAAGVEQLRQALVPLAGMPLQLEALQQLHSERLTHHIANHDRDVRNLTQDLDAESGRRRSADEALERRLNADVKALEARQADAVKEVKDWQVWAMRVVFGLVIAAVLGVVLVAP